LKYEAVEQGVEADGIDPISWTPLDGGKPIPEVARDLDLTESALRLWVRRAQADRGEGKPGELTTVEREELQRLRREVKELRLEREILKKAAAFFARENG